MKSAYKAIEPKIADFIESVTETIMEPFGDTYESTESQPTTESVEKTEGIVTNSLSRGDKKLLGAESQVKNVTDHLKKLDDLGDKPDPHNSGKIWRDHIVKAYKELAKDLKQAGKKDFEKWLVGKYGVDKIKEIYEKSRQYGINPLDYLKK